MKGVCEDDGDGPQGDGDCGDVLRKDKGIGVGSRDDDDFDAVHGDGCVSTSDGRHDHD